MKKWLALCFLVCSAAYAQQQNVSQIPDCSLGFCAGNGVPTFSCNSGQKYAQVDNPGVNFTCTGTPAHWVQDSGSGSGSISLTTTGSSGPATLSAGVLNIPQYGGGSGAGVTSINTNTGAFTFNGSGVSCSGTTCTFSSSGGSMTWPGAAGIANYNGSSAWGTSYSSANLIPANFIPTLNQSTTGNAATATVANSLPASAGFTTTTNGQIGYDTTNLNWHMQLAGGDYFLVPLVKSGLTSGHCVQLTEIGAWWEFADAGAACGSGGGGSGLTYASPTLNAIPAVSNVTSPGTVVDSSFSDDTHNTFDSEPFYLVGEYQQAVGTANSSNNYVSNVTNWLISYWNGSAAVSAAWNVYAWVAQGASPPASVLTYYAPANLTTTAVLYAIDPSLAATSSINYNSPRFKTRGSCWNGTVSTLDDWNWQGVPGTGTNPTETLQFTHSGCSGSAAVEMPGLKLDGSPEIASGVSTNSDVSGEFTLSSATTAGPYTWQNTYANHPECVLQPQFSSTVAYWVTYSGTTSFTINFASAVSGAVSYLCLGRN